jgi:hypothetical protein
MMRSAKVVSKMMLREVFLRGVARDGLSIYFWLELSHFNDYGSHRDRKNRGQEY